MMRVWIVRHGESETNRTGTWTGWLDVPLTEKGEKDATFARTVLSGKSFDAVYSSDLSRAERTASIALPGCNAEVSPLLREINVGTFAGKTYSLITDEQKKTAAEEGYAFVGGESKEELTRRVTRFMKMLESSGYESVAIFTHAGWLRRFLDLTVGTCLPRNTVVCKNCAVGIFEYDGAWRLHSWINQD